MRIIKMAAAQDKIHEYLKFGSKLGLERMKKLCAALGNPEADLRVIHVAGTNGKGSVCRYIYEVLRALGYTAGIFTSPYVGDFRERIEANGKMISNERLETLTDKALAAAEKLALEGDPPTEFELITAIGLLYFAEEMPDFVILEVGLGGRGDSTNIIKEPLVSIITKIALDHMDRLGDTEEKIAFEKAGIIKAGFPVVSGAEGEAAKVIARQAYELGAPLINSSKIKYSIMERSPRGYVFNAVIEGKRYDRIELSMAGEHQVQNAITALCALDLMRAKGFIRFDGAALRKGMKAARLNARFHIASEEPPVIFDGAHNPDGARALTKTLRELFPKGRILFVCSILRDKCAQDMLAEFAGVAAAFIVTVSSNERALPIDELSEKIMLTGVDIIAKADTPEEAYAIAKDMAKGYDVIVFAGSLYMVGDVIRGCEEIDETRAVDI